MLNLFQHLTASLYLFFSADRSWNKFRMTDDIGSLLTTQRRLEDAKPKGRIGAGSWTRGIIGKTKKWRLERRGTATLTTDSRLYRRHYCVVIKNRGLESPRLFMFPSFRRIFSHFSLLITQRSSLKSVCKDAKPEGQIAAGFQTRGIIDKIKKWRLQRRGTATLTTDSRLCRHH